MISRERRDEIIGALRRGTVPRAGLDTFAVGLERFEGALEEEFAAAKQGRGTFKAVQGEYGSGKTFFARWLEESAKRQTFATAEVQISETETPLHKLETVYRRLVENLSTAEFSVGALRNIIDGWFYTLEQDVVAEGSVTESDTQSILARTNELMEQRLAGVTRRAPAFSAVLRGYRAAQAAGDRALADSLIAWLSGEPNVAVSAKRAAGIKGVIDHFGALSSLEGLLVVLRDSSYAGLLIVLDEVETLQRVRGDVRDKGLNALRQLIDEIDSGRFPGLFLLMTGTPAFFDGPQGAQRLAPLAQRLQVDYATDARFDNPRAVRIRLSGFDLEKLCAVGARVRDIYAAYSAAPERLGQLANNSYVADLAAAVVGKLGGRVGVAPRIFLKKLVADILDRIDQFPEFRPREHYALTLAKTELNQVERSAARGIDDVEIDV